MSSRQEKLDTTIPEYYEKLLDERFKNLKDDLENLSGIAKDVRSIEKNVGTLTQISADNTKMIRVLFILVCILFVMYIAHISGVTISIFKIFSLL